MSLVGAHSRWFIHSFIIDLRNIDHDIHSSSNVKDPLTVCSFQEAIPQAMVMHFFDCHHEARRPGQSTLPQRFQYEVAQTVHEDLEQHQKRDKLDDS